MQRTPATTTRPRGPTRSIPARRPSSHPPNVRFDLLAALTASCLALCGCTRTDRQDARLTELAKHTQTQQAKLNEQIAKQSEAVVNESAKLAETAKELVAQDAEARRELIDAQQTLQGDLNSERSRLDSQNDRLEAERRQIAVQRHRDPIIAQAIAGFALTIACLGPLPVGTADRFDDHVPISGTDRPRRAAVSVVRAGAPACILVMPNGQMTLRLPVPSYKRCRREEAAGPE